MSRRKPQPGSSAPVSPGAEETRAEERRPVAGRIAADVGILAALFAATVGVAELAGAANLGVALGIGQVVFAIALVALLLRD
jgi:hypothetical protein